MASTIPIPLDLDEYDAYISNMREREYPMLRDSLYLDHAGTTLYSKSLMDRFHANMVANLYGNPHSASPSSQRSTLVIDEVRLQVLRFFQADPKVFDLVFTANATAAIKLVGDAFREMEGGFEFGYHVDSHTSLVGLRELARKHVCLELDGDVEDWLTVNRDTKGERHHRLFAYPAQSNMNGRRLPLAWSRRSPDEYSSSRVFTLLDAAAYVSTSPLDLADADAAPDFVTASFNKIFGFPDLGALIVKKDAAHVFDHRKYFGGGTVDMVVCLKEDWYARKSGPLHERLEDGTLPVHSIVALKSALQTHTELFGSLDQIARHTARLAKQLYEGLSSMKHANGEAVCKVYKSSSSFYGDSHSQGPIVAFNLRDGLNEWVSAMEVERLASINRIHLRAGAVCNPGGFAAALDLAPWEMRENFAAGFRCNSENDIFNLKPTGLIRVSLGAMSTKSDLQSFMSFIEDFYREREVPLSVTPPPVAGSIDDRFYVESLTIYPIKSCGGWSIAYGSPWEIRAEGLAWDREWCLVHAGNGKALSQKQYPRMALLRPALDFKGGILRVTFAGTLEEIAVPLSRNPRLYADAVRDCEATVCGDVVRAFTYRSTAIADFFTRALGVDCTLARHNPASTESRHGKLHLQPREGGHSSLGPRPILMSNESPILTISRSSLNRLNEQIKENCGKAAHPSVFRANIVLAESRPGQERPWAEDCWTGLQIGDVNGPHLEVLGGCRRCQMVCVDQQSGQKNREPFLTLAQTRRIGGRVYFGVHTALADGQSTRAVIKVGDEVQTLY